MPKTPHWTFLAALAGGALLAMLLIASKGWLPKPVHDGIVATFFQSVGAIFLVTAFASRNKAAISIAQAKTRSFFGAVFLLNGYIMAPDPIALFTWSLDPTLILPSATWSIGVLKGLSSLAIAVAVCWLLHHSWKPPASKAQPPASPALA